MPAPHRSLDILKTSIADMLDGFEDPLATIDEYLQECRATFEELHPSVATAVAEEERTWGLVERNRQETARFAELARRALQAGNENDARIFLAKKRELEANEPDLIALYDSAHESADSMRHVHDDLITTMRSLTARRRAIESKIALAEAQSKAYGLFENTGKLSHVMSALEEMDEKADSLLERLNALAELDQRPPDHAASLAERYEESKQGGSLEDELAAMKASLGAPKPGQPEPDAQPAAEAQTAAAVQLAAADRPANDVRPVPDAQPVAAVQPATDMRPVPDAQTAAASQSQEGR